MEIEEQIKIKLLLRGFSEKTILNNRGLIGAVIEDMIIIMTRKKLKDETNPS